VSLKSDLRTTAQSDHTASNQLKALQQLKSGFSKAGYLSHSILPSLPSPGFPVSHKVHFFDAPHTPSLRLKDQRSEPLG